VPALSGVDVQTEIMIARPRHHVAAYTGDPGNASSWYATIETVEWHSPPPGRIGSRIAFLMATADGPFPMERTYTWQDAAGGGTRMTLRNRGAPTGFSKLTAPVAGRAVRRANVKDLARLKAILESTTES
jgi:hypothetical protein